MADRLVRKIAWLVPYPLEGSGGHRTIYQNLAALAKRGYECHVYVEPRFSVGARGDAAAAQAKQLAESYFGAIPATFHVGFERIEPADVIFATAWFTAVVLRRLQTSAIKAYFVQDLEGAFQPIGDQSLTAEHTFRYGFSCITIGRWLALRLERDFGAKAGSFDFCADLNIYRRLDIPRERAVCFLYQPDKPRRCSKIGTQALAIVRQLHPEVRIYLYGSDSSEPNQFGFDHLGLLSVEQCNRLYNRCQVGLCISTTNPSRIPFEMMAAGLPVVDLFGENTIYDLPSSAIRLAEPSPESIAHAIIGLLQDTTQRQSMSSAGTSFIEQRDLQAGFFQFVAFVDALLEGNAHPAAAREPLYCGEPTRAGAAADGYLAMLDAAAAGARRRLSHGGRFVAHQKSITKRVTARLSHTLRVLLTGN